MLHATVNKVKLKECSGTSLQNTSAFIECGDQKWVWFFDYIVGHNYVRSRSLMILVCIDMSKYAYSIGWCDVHDRLLM